MTNPEAVPNPNPVFGLQFFAEAEVVRAVRAEDTEDTSAFTD